MTNWSLCDIINIVTEPMSLLYIKIVQKARAISDIKWQYLVKGEILVDYIANPDRLRAKMDEFGYSNARLADAAGVSEGTIKRLMRGETSTRPTLSLVAIALDVSIDWLVSPDALPLPTDVSPIPENAQDYPDPGEAKALVDRLEKSYQAQIESLKQRIEAIRELYFRERREKQKIMIFAVILVVFLCVWLTVDVINPSVGWLRR